MIRLIGYWHSDEEPHWPDPAWFVDPNWNIDERVQVVAYLRSAAVPRAAGGSSWCRFRCAVRWVGSVEHTDGAYLWPEGLGHYVEHHGVRLPHEFTDHVLKRETPQEAVLSLDTPIDTAWWLAQRGPGLGASFRSPAPRGRFIADLQGTKPTPSVLAALREFWQPQQLSVTELRERIRDGASLVLLTSEYEMPRPAVLAKLDALGIAVRFQSTETTAAG